MDNTMYNFNVEDEQEDAILNRAYDRWEQMGGGADEEEGTDQFLNRAYDRWEQFGGGAVSPLFKFQLKQIGKRRTWRNVVQRENFNAQLMQMRDPIPNDNIGMALTEALYQAIETELLKQNRPHHHFVNLAITANGFQHAYQTVNFTVGEFLQRTQRLDEMLNKLAGKLNSNEGFNPSQGFEVEVVMVSMPGPGSGHGKKYNAGRLCLDRENKKKKCIVTIKNNDKLCCARAIVTMRAHCHKDQGVDELRQWDSLKKGTQCTNVKSKTYISKRGWLRVPVACQSFANFNSRWALNTNSW